MLEFGTLIFGVFGMEFVLQNFGFGICSIGSSGLGFCLGICNFVIAVLEFWILGFRFWVLGMGFGVQSLGL